MTVVTNRLQGRNITNFPPEVIVQKLAEDNRRSAQSIYEAIQGHAEPARSGSGHGGGQGRTKGGSGTGMATGPGILDTRRSGPIKKLYATTARGGQVTDANIIGLSQIL